jgi:hypothetical protein
MTNEQAIAELQALKGAPGFQQHWQERVQKIIDHLSAPPTPPVQDVEPTMEEWEGDTEQSSPEPKAKHKAAAHTAAAKTKGKK